VTATANDILFRCDAGAVDGLGHLRRCLSLAETLTLREWTSLFVVSEGEGQIAPDILTRAHVPFHVSDGPVGTQNDLKTLSTLRSENNAEILVVDSKRADATYHNRLRDMYRLAVIDDDGGSVSADLVINAGLDADTALYSASSTVDRYVVGRDFNFVPPALFKTSPRPADDCVLITMGGEDPEDRTSWIVETLARHKPDLALRVVIGPAHPDPNSALDAVSRHPKAEPVIAPNGLAEEIATCSVAISAGGTTCYELTAARRPFAVILLEDHQEKFAMPFITAGAALLANTVTNWETKNLVSAIDHLLSPSRSEAIQDAQKEILPASGLDAVADAIMDLTTIRKHKQ